MTVQRQRMEEAIRALLASHPDPALHSWVRETAAAFDVRLRAIQDPAERDEARQAALVFINITLKSWSQNPPLQH